MPLIPIAIGVMAGLPLAAVFGFKTANNAAQAQSAASGMMPLIVLGLLLFIALKKGAAWKS